MWTTVWSILSVLALSTNAWEMYEPVESIQGTYKITQMTIEENPPMLATLWDLTAADFSVSAWPPKYCHAIHICFVDAKVRASGDFHVTKDLCQGQFAKWYPHIHRVDFKNHATKPIQTKFYQMSSLHFTLKMGYSYSLEVHDKEFTQHTEWVKIWQKSNPRLDIDLTGKAILLLTNSRFCLAHVTQATGSKYYYSLLAPSTHTGSLPKYLTSYDVPTGHTSIFKPYLTVPSTKSVDLLAYVKNMKDVDTSKMRQKKTCTSFRTTSTNKLRSSIGTVAADSWVASIANANAAKRMENFYVYIGGKCSWLRLWISDDPADSMKTYSSKMKLADTIDLFFEQQFFVPPDSDEARPFNGDANHIGYISFRRFTVDPKIPEKVVEMSYGRNRNDVQPYLEYFHMPSFHGGSSAGTAFRVTLIKAPDCEAVLVPGNQIMRFSSADERKTNVMNFQNCVHTLHE